MKVKTLKKAALLIGLLGLTIMLIQYSRMEITSRAVYESGRIDVFFCPEDDCYSKITSEISKASTVHCAFYTVDSNLSKVLKEKNALLVTDKDNKNSLSLDAVKNYGTSQLMHNKFCILDNSKIITGSFNPTYKEVNNTNNVLIISSKVLAQNYEVEFQELYNKEFGEGSKNSNPVVYLNNNEIDNYFCPDDGCSSNVVNVLKYANKSILFFDFSFTDKVIAETLIAKHEQGIDVKGLFEETQESAYSQFNNLKAAGLDVKLYEKKYKLHDKVFVIDDSIVITGSYNPTNNANKYNDENILIIHDRVIAKKYVDRFNFLYS